MITACGSTEVEESGADLTGKPVQLMVIAPVDTTAQNFPGLYPAAQAAARSINAGGGIKGGPVQVEFCNDKNDPVAGEQCAREAVAKGVTAVVGYASPVSSGKIHSILDAAGIPVIGGAPLTSADFTSPLAYNLDGGSLSSYPLCPTILAEEGGTKHGIVRYDVDAAAGILPLVKKGAEAAGLQDTGLEVRVPASATDFSSFARQIADSGADSVTFVLPEQLAVQLISTMSDQGVDVNMCTSDTALSIESLTGLGPAAEKVYNAGFIPMTTTGNEDVEAFTKDMQAQYDAGDEGADPAVLTEASYRAWVGPHIISRMAEQIDGELTAANLVAALNAGTAVDADMFGSIDFTQPGPVQPSVRNMTGYMLEWDESKQQRTLISPDPVDTAPFYAAR
jgi:ABC-type branched-subunit amino acid transport system substrate-binding protein